MHYWYVSDCIYFLCLQTRLTFDSEMDPPIEVSVTRVNPDRWILGSSIICESVEDRKLKPANAIVDWQDGGRTFYLRENTDSSTSAGDAEIDIIQHASTRSAIWSIGNNAICKVNAWCEGLELEANTIQFVREHAGEVPVPEVIHTWIDHNLSRTFLITKRVSGRTLQQAWPELSSSNRIQIADDIARYCNTLAMKTSSLYETATGCGVNEERLMEYTPDSHPSYLPRTMGPFTSQAILAHMRRGSIEPPPNIDTDALFHFYNPYLGPVDIMISEEGGHVTGIINWEAGAYFPRFYIATKPAVSWSFWLRCPTDDRALWGQLLSKALQTKGFESSDTIFTAWILGTPAWRNWIAQHPTVGASRIRAD